MSDTSSASWPSSIKNFTTFLDYQDINYAEDLNEIHAEVESLEKVLGINPYANLPSSYVTLNAALTDLYFNKAPVAHNHTHHNLLGDTSGNDHSQYALLSGAVFTGPITAPPATVGGQLATLGQLQAQGFADEDSVQAEINAQLAYRCTGSPSGSQALAGSSTTYGWKLIGGYNEGCTGTGDATLGITEVPGQIVCPFGGGSFSQVLQSFVPSKANTGLGTNHIPSGYFPCPVYNPATANITLVTAALNYAIVEFTDKATGNPIVGHVAFSFLAAGI